MQGHWVVTGGAGYVGGHVVRALHRAGVDVVVVDDLSTGLAGRLPAGVPLLLGQVGDRRVLDACLPGAGGVVHLAAQTSAPGSVRDPLAHYRANVGDVVTMTSAMAEHGIGRLVTSSSAAVYGDVPGSDRRAETDPLHPQSPYGTTKMVGERILADLVVCGLSSVALRYFNVAGAGTQVLADNKVGGLPLAVLQARRTGEPVPVHGLDHPTPDGSAVRDYVHAVDVASAHVAAVELLLAGSQGAAVYNVGTGIGSSVLDVLRVAAEVTGGPVPHRVHGRRPGDPSHAVADVSAIARDLGWRARHDLRDCQHSAWEASGGPLPSHAGGRLVATG
ncbi:UDP-glucose 4-epimerase GalE [Klenkia sp. PcliD-1-E]|uniref:UDP-glucose 4-epimerase GalE n=1 Tax=Klenkia sp. PcliD-1-E TaxID=2954492 RepID=UPI0020968F73|nr:UDP-glucose 4-epimerase GalE [Klenkia sp. PcliD-1-E]MCO7218393.1 UDP-glucose 4-epimerase GalE [Klenkia sp. PcliD-1-E]